MKSSRWTHTWPQKEWVCSLNLENNIQDRLSRLHRLSAAQHGSIFVLASLSLGFVSVSASNCSAFLRKYSPTGLSINSFNAMSYFLGFPRFSAHDVTWEISHWRYIALREQKRWNAERWVGSPTGCKWRKPGLGEL